MLEDVIVAYRPALDYFCEKSFFLSPSSLSQNYLVLSLVSRCAPSFITIRVVLVCLIISFQQPHLLIRVLFSL